ncbi:MAG TPA: hypothetical protein VK348_06575 [Planctomycetota bacterium]|nr:hypothetical protein [Planctomycetota bacterium]
MKPARALPFTAVLVLLLPLAAQDKVAAQDKQQHLLRYQFKDGSIQHFGIHMGMDMKGDMGGTNFNVTTQMVLFLETRIGASKDGKAAVSSTAYRLTLKMDNPMMQIDYDSDQKDSDPGMLKEMAEIVGKTFTMMVDDRGRVTDAKAPEGLDDGVMQQLMGGDLNGFFGQYYPELPEKPIEVGASWDYTRKMEVGQMGQSATKVNSKLTKVEGGKAFLDHEFQIDFKGAEAGPRPELKKAVGTSVLDLATGTLGGSEMKIDMSVGGEQGGHGMKMEMATTMAMKPEAPPARKDAAKGEAKDAGRDAQKKDAQKKDPQKDAKKDGK